MNSSRRNGILAALAVALVAAGVSPAFAQAWPARPIRIIVPHAPGGVTDVVTRVVAQPLGEALGQAVVVENRPGAAGLLGTEVAAKAAPDGYTWVMFVDTNTIFPSTVKQLHHDPATSFVPVTILGRGSHVLIAHSSVPASNLKELVAFAKANPGTLSIASPGSGSPQHLAFEILKLNTGIDVVHVPYKGGGAAIADVVGGQLKLGILGMAPALPHIRAGRLKAIATTGKARAAVLPDVQTFAESGVPGLETFETGQWQGLAGPAGVPPAIVARMHDELVKVMKQPAVVEKLAGIGMEPIYSPTPADFARMIQDELQRWPAAVKAAGIQPE